MTDMRTKSGQWLVGYARGANAAVAWHTEQAEHHDHLEDVYANGPAETVDLAKHHAALASEHRLYASSLKSLARRANNEIERRCDEEDRARERADNGQFGVGA